MNSKHTTLGHLRRHAHWFLAGTAYLLLTIAITYPLALHLNSRMAGRSPGDTLEFVWSTWWWKHALLDLRQNPIHISVLNHPLGLEFPLLPLMSQTFLLALPLAALVSPVFAYNSVFLASFVLCGLSGYAFCTDLSRDRRAGFVGGLVWAFFPNKMGHALAGHLFQLVVFSFPLAALTWVRLFRTPTTRNAVWAGLALALSATVHPIYLVYFVAPLVIALLGNALWSERLAFWNQERLGAIALGFGLAAALILPLLIPTLTQALSGQLNFLSEPGAVRFSIDGLAYFLPAPNNPLISHTPLADLSDRVADRVASSQDESIAYLGWVPLLLAILGARTKWLESRIWVLLALVAGLLALGPLLKFGGGLVQTVVDGSPYPVVMPYSLISRLPFFQWSRTPARLIVLVMLPLSVLVAYGFNHLSHLPALRRISPALLLLSVCVLILAEYLVGFPFPTSRADRPGLLETLRADQPGLGVMDLPIPDYGANELYLYWQTIHQHPLVGGRVYRDIPGGQTEYDFLSHLLLSAEGADIVPSPTDEQRRAVFATSRVGWVLYDAQMDSNAAVRSALEARLGPPSSQEGQLWLFPLAHGELRSEDMIWVLGGTNWFPAQDWGGAPGRWFSEQGLVYVFSSSARSGRLAFTAVPGQDLHRLTVHVNGVSAGQFVVGDWAEYRTGVVRLNPGLNLIEFEDMDGARHYVGDPRCAGGSPVSGPYPVPVPCDSADRMLHDMSLVISNLRLVPDGASPSFTPSGAMFGDSVQLLGFNVPDRTSVGKAVTIHLVWQATAASAEDFTVFLHLAGPDGTLVAQNDTWPVNGAYPTSRWSAGEVIAYNVTLAPPPGAAPGKYTVQIGLYSWPSLERLPVSGVVGATDNVVSLATVNVEP